MFQKLIQFDRSLFEKINSDWTNPLFDSIMPFMRHSMHWIPLYLFIFVFVVLNYRYNWLWWAVFFLATVALTDMTGTYLFKHNIERLRPCNDPLMSEHIRLIINRCAGGYSFISNHAANHFGMAMFFFLTFRNELKKWAWVGFPWAVVIGYAQIYVGVHYPIDILAGALLGLGFGTLTATVFNKRYGFAIFEQQRHG